MAYPKFLYRITPEGGFFVYKVKRDSIVIHDSGLAWSRGKYSKDIKDAAKRYNLDIEAMSSWSIQNTFDQFCLSLYFAATMDKAETISLPKGVVKYLKFKYNTMDIGAKKGKILGTLYTQLEKEKDSISKDLNDAITKVVMAL